MVPFLFNPNQEKLYQALCKQYDEQKYTRLIILKARRTGMSSLTDALLFCHCLAYPNQNAQIVAHLAKSSNALFRVPKDLAKNLPFFDKRNIQERRIIFPHRAGRSILDVATAGTPSAGRGETMGAIHLSECAFYPGEESFTSLITTVSRGEGTIIILESTANGREGPGSAFADYWDDAVEGNSDFLPIFLSWLDDPDCVSDEEEAEDAPADDLEKELMNNFHATRSQIAWMRRTKATQCRNLEPLWLQEFPHTPDVSFQVSGDPAFPRDELSYAQSTEKDPIWTGSIKRSSQNRMELIKAAPGSLHVWEWPHDENGRKNDNQYFVGADAALGTQEGDFAAYTVFNGTTGNIAARFAERIHPEHLADHLDMVGRFYNRAMVNVELTGNLGRWSQKLLRDKYCYPNIYIWKGKDDRKAGKGGKGLALGFETTQATRRLLFDSFRACLRQGMRGEEGGLILNDRVLIHQMSIATIKDWSWDVQRDHDDILFSSMLAVLTAMQYPPIRYGIASKNIADQSTHMPRGIKTTDELSASLKRHFHGVVHKTRQRDRLMGI